MQSGRQSQRRGGEASQNALPDTESRALFHLSHATGRHGKARGLTSVPDFTGHPRTLSDGVVPDILRKRFEDVQHTGIQLACEVLKTEDVCAAGEARPQAAEEKAGVLGGGAQPGGFRSIQRKVQHHQFSTGRVA